MSTDGPRYPGESDDAYAFRQGVDYDSMSWKEREVALEDLRAILRALGLGGHARPISAHQVVHEEILPKIHRLCGGSDAEQG